MKKRYLLIAGDNYYPGAETEDWKGRYDTEEEAIAAYHELTTKRNCQYGGRAGFDWYTIVDLETTLV